ncbi:hypothetical protein V6N11_033400 [Hibiscus sabdariffa]|uniref:RNase H type-1 domain-containing protein n=1 Tax=Hibiscus sabdariffa TaxID=183260 RepID=A0ABR2PY25_9ROSI
MYFWESNKKSIESDSTLGSDYSLSSLEIDLFGDIHAKVNQSIQFVEFQLPTSKSNRHSKSPLLNPLQPPEDQKLLQMEWGRQQKKPPILLKHRDHGPYETSSNDTWRMGASIREFLDLMLSWDERVKVLKDVASAVCYLYQGWEAKVLHRDIKASNVILDKDMNASAVRGIDSLASAGGVFCDDHGRWVYGYAHRLGRHSVLMAELWAAHDILLAAWDLGFRHVQMETNNLDVAWDQNLVADRVVTLCQYPSIGSKVFDLVPGALNDLVREEAEAG